MCWVIFSSNLLSPTVLSKQRADLAIRQAVFDPFQLPDRPRANNIRGSSRLLQQINRQRLKRPNVVVEAPGILPTIEVGYQ